MTDKETILSEAEGLIYGDRAASYGKVTDNFTRIAAGWAVILGIPVTPEQVGLCMIWLKLAREINKPGRDNLVDIAGYVGCLEKLQNGE